MKRIMKHAIVFILINAQVYAVVEPIIPGERLWDITERIGTTVDTIEEKVCNIEIITESAQDDLAIIESKTCIIESKVDVLQNIQNECYSVIESIDSKLDVLQSHSDMIESKIDIVDNKIDELQSTQDECCSVVEDIDSKVDILQSHSDIIESKTCLIDSKVDILQTTQDSCCSVVEDIDSKLDVLIEDSCVCCDVKITALPYTITQSGVYCLTEPDLSINMDETGITIAAGTTDVVLDLGGHEINGQNMVNTMGILIETGCAQVCVRNGIIRNTQLSGIRAINCNQLVFKNLKIDTVSTIVGQAGIFLVGSLFVDVEQVQVSNAQIGYNIVDPGGSSIFRLCRAFNCNIGFGTSSANNNCFIECKSQNNSTGYSVTGNFNVFNSCVAQSNSDFGFCSVTSSNQFLNCISLNNGSDGFRIAGEFNALRGCIANQNTENGIQIIEIAPLNDTNSVMGCITVGNGMNGIITNLSASDHVVNCLSHNNGTDYSGVTVTVTPPIPTTTGFWANVS